MNEIWHGDCLELMKNIPDKSIDMILCDLPYGTTACRWDTIIPFEPLWEEYKRVIKDNGAIVLTANQPFTSALVMSNPKWYRHAWVWDKLRGRGHLVVKYRPMQQTEDILVFGKQRVNYNPQTIPRDVPRFLKEGTRTKIMGGKINEDKNGRWTSVFQPVNIIKIKPESKPIHPTQKPIALFEYLIKTYTNEGDLVLDNCAGSGTTGIAARNLNRQFILIEQEQEYIDIINERLSTFDNQLNLFDT